MIVQVLHGNFPYDVDLLCLFENCNLISSSYKQIEHTNDLLLLHHQQMIF